MSQTDQCDCKADGLSQSRREHVMPHDVVDSIHRAAVARGPAACIDAAAGAARSAACTRPCARSISACRWRRRTSCTPRPMSPRSSACSPSTASTPTSCSSKAASRQPRRPRRRRAPRSSASATSPIGRGLKVQQIWGLAPRMPQAYMVPRRHQDRGRPQGQAAVARPAAASAASTGGWAARCSKSAGLNVDDAQFISVARRPAGCPA